VETRAGDVEEVSLPPELFVIAGPLLALAPEPYNLAMGETRDFTETVVRIFLGLYGQSVQATESVAYRVERESGLAPRLHLITHIRPGECDEATRRFALTLFERWATACAKSGKPAMIEAGMPPAPAQFVQFCLIVPIPNAPSAPLLFALIVNAAGLDEARGKLDTLLRR
jgi:hypothetical protein